MTLQEAAQFLNRPVMFYDKIHRFSGEYLLSAVVVRKNDAGMYLQAELTDRSNSNSVLLAGLDSILPICA